MNMRTQLSALEFFHSASLVMFMSDNKTIALPLIASGLKSAFGARGDMVQSAVAPKDAADYSYRNISLS